MLGGSPAREESFTTIPVKLDATPFIEIER